MPGELVSSEISPQLLVEGQSPQPGRGPLVSCFNLIHRAFALVPLIVFRRLQLQDLLQMCLQSMNLGRDKHWSEVRVGSTGVLSAEESHELYADLRASPLRHFKSCFVSREEG